MASDSTEKTILAVGAVGLGALIIWWWIKRHGAAAQQQQGGSVGGANYYPPYAGQDGSQPQNPLQSLLNALGGGSGSGGGGKNNQGQNNGSTGYGDDYQYAAQNALNYEKSGGGDFGGQDLLDQFASSDTGPGTPGGLFQIPFEDDQEQLSVPGTFIDSSTDGSANAVSAGDYADVLSYSEPLTYDNSTGDVGNVAPEDYSASDGGDDGGGDDS